MLKKILVEFGMSELEAKIYTGLLELEIATVQKLARHTGTNRSSLYVLLERMEKKGYILSGNNRIRQTYSAAAPDLILKIAQDRAAKENSILKKISSVIPELKAVHKDTRSKPRVKIYEGKDGIIEAFEDTLTTNENLMRVSSTMGSLLPLLPDYFPKYVEERRKRGIKIKSIHPDDSAARLMISFPPTDFDLPVLIPQNKYPFPADLAIYGEKIAYMSVEGNGIAIVIESKEMAEVMKSVFDLAYEEAKRVSAKNSGE